MGGKGGGGVCRMETEPKGKDRDAVTYLYLETRE